LFQGGGRHLSRVDHTTQEREIPTNQPVEGVVYDRRFGFWLPESAPARRVVIVQKLRMLWPDWDGDALRLVAFFTDAIPRCPTRGLVHN
jgi:hypothetical protein